jgi:hypothetical protein
MTKKLCLSFKNKKNMNKETKIKKYADFIKRGKYDFTFELENYSVEELEKLADASWQNDDEAQELFRLILKYRKRKLNQQFVFNQENIDKIVRLNEQLKDSFKQMQNEVKQEFLRLNERTKANEIDGFCLDCTGSILAEFPCKDVSISDYAFLPHAYSILNGNLLSASFSSNSDIEQIRQCKLFDFSTNFAEKIGTGTVRFKTDKDGKKSISAGVEWLSNKELAQCHIGYVFYKLYSDSCFSLSDMLQIYSVRSEITARLTHTTLIQ